MRQQIGDRMTRLSHNRRSPNNPRGSGRRGGGHRGASVPPSTTWADILALPGASFRLDSQTGITGDPVTAWAEQWQGGNLVTGNAPDYDATGLDGKPGVAFNGTANYLLDSTISIASGDKTIYLVVDNTTVTAAVRITAAFTAAGAGRLYVYQHDVSGNVAIFDGGALRSTGVAATTGPQILRFTLDSGGAAGSSTVHRDGTQIGTLTCGAIGAIDGVTMCRSPGSAIQFGALTLGTLLVFNALHTAEQAEEVEAFLASTFLAA